MQNDWPRECMMVICKEKSLHHFYAIKIHKMAFKYSTTSLKQMWDNARSPSPTICFNNVTE